MPNRKSGTSVVAILSHTFEWLPWSFGDMRAGVVVQQKNSMLPIGSFHLNSCHRESVHLLNIEFCVDRLVSFMHPMSLAAVVALEP